MANYLNLLQRYILPDAKVTSKYEFGKYLNAYITSVYDGDTITVKFYQFKDTAYQESIRLDGINTPEVCVRNSSSKFPKLEEMAGRHVRDYVRNLALKGSNYCYINISSTDDKYKRPLCHVYLDQKIYPFNAYPEPEECLHLNKHLLDKKYAKPYFGNTKENFNAQELLSMLGAENGFHTIDWDHNHKDFLSCINEVIEYYIETNKQSYINHLRNKVSQLKNIKITPSNS